MDVEAIDAFVEELGDWVVSAPPKPYDGVSEFVLWCPWHEDPATSKKPSATWNPIAKNEAYTLGVINCYRPDCGIPANAKIVRKRWRNRRAARETTSNSLIDRSKWKVEGGPKVHGKARPQPEIDDEDFAGYQELLFEDSRALKRMLNDKGITGETLRAFEWAWCPGGKSCYVYRVYRLDGELEGHRLYDPFHPDRDKKRWYATEARHTNQLWGTKQCASDGPAILLWEGETDNMLAWQDGFKNSVTQTGGAGTWKPEWNNFFKGKVVYTCYDADEAGRAGRELVADNLQGFAEAVYHVNLPAGLDYSDWRKAGHKPDEFKQLIKDAKEAWRADHGGLPSSGIPLRSVADLKNAIGENETIQLRAYIAGKKQEPWRVPKVADVSCKQNQGRKCQGCPMFAGEKGQPTNRQFHMSPHKDDSLIAIMGAEDTKKNNLIRKALDLHCTVIEVDPNSEVWHVEQVSIQDPVDISNNVMSDTRYSAYHFYTDNNRIEASHDYKLVGRRLSDPRNQQLVIAAWNAERTTTDLDNFAVTPDMKRRLRTFSPPKQGLGALRIHLRKKYADLSANVTKIANRRDLHLLYDLVAHSVLEFDFDGVYQAHGPMDALVIGDTRTGKSDTATRLNEHYGIGIVASGENSSYAGLVGGSAEISNSRERMPQWGILPRHHKRMVVIDEASGMDNLLQRMSGVRTSGVARIDKIGGGAVPCLVRLLWLSNPAPHDRSNRTRTLAEASATMAIRDLVKAEEDIARFDVAMAVAEGDVATDQIIDLRSEEVPHKYTSELCHDMVMFAWSRRRDQITFAEGVTTAIYDAGRELASKYATESLPLVQRANMDVKIARMAISLATMTYSVLQDGETVVVRPEHVEYVSDFIQRCYDHDRFGYDRESHKHHRMIEKGDANTEMVRDYLSGKKVDDFKNAPEGKVVAAMLLSFQGQTFTPREAGEMTRDMSVGDLIMHLVELGMLTRRSGRFVSTTALTKILDSLEEQ